MTTTKHRLVGRTFNLTSLGHHAVWFLNQRDQLAKRPTSATAPCACCDTVYSVEGLKPLDSDEIYMRASEVVSFERDDLVCKFCRDDFQVDFGTPDTDVYHVFDLGIDPAD